MDHRARGPNLFKESVIGMLKEEIGGVGLAAEFKPGHLFAQ